MLCSSFQTKKQTALQVNVIVLKSLYLFNLMHFLLGSHLILYGAITKE